METSQIRVSTVFKFIFKDLNDLYLFTESLDQNLDFSNFVISHRQKLISCLPNKVASSTLLLTFLALKGIKIDEIHSPHSKLEDVTAQVPLNDLFK